VKAVKYWEKIDKTPNVYANLIVGYRDLGNIKKSMEASALGFELYDKGLKEDSQTLASLVANTMATLMHMQELRDAVELYKSRYISKGKTSDSALLQQYAMLNVLVGKVDTAQELIVDGSFSSDEVQYVHLLISLHNKKKKESMNIALKILGMESSKMKSNKVWDEIASHFEDAGYLGSEKLREMIAWAKDNTG
jgi:hypothetical protein